MKLISGSVVNFNLNLNISLDEAYFFLWDFKNMTEFRWRLNCLLAFACNACVTLMYTSLNQYSSMGSHWG